MMSSWLKPRYSVHATTYTETTCHGEIRPDLTDEQWPAGKPFGGCACWCQGLPPEDRECSVRNYSTHYDVYPFDVPHDHADECWTFSTDRCRNYGCGGITIWGMSKRFTDLVLYHGGWEDDEPCDPKPLGWCGQLECESCYHISPSIREELPEGRHYLIVTSDSLIAEKYGPFAYDLHVIHPVGTDFNCQQPPPPPSDVRLVLVKGFDGSAFSGSPQGQDCEQYFQTLIDDFGAWGIPRAQIATVSTYHNDTPGTCDVGIGDYPANNPDRHSTHFGEDMYPGSHTPTGGHTTNTSWRHLGYHLAWYLATLPGPVDIVAHSGGGIIVRYALMQSQLGNPDFPPQSALHIRDVVTHGTPHNGVPRWESWACKTVGHENDRQCEELKGNNPLVRDLKKSPGRNPAGAGGTEWTVTGSNVGVSLLGKCAALLHDPIISEDSTIAMQTRNKVIWDPVMVGSVDPLLCIVYRSITHASGLPGMPPPAYVSYYHDGPSKAKDVPARVRGASRSQLFEHVDWATYRAVKENGR